MAVQMCLSEMWDSIGSPRDTTIPMNMGMSEGSQAKILAPARGPFFGPAMTKAKTTTMGCSAPGLF